MRNVVIVAACRTPIGTIGGQFKTLTATELSIPVISCAESRIESIHTNTALETGCRLLTAESLHFDFFNQVIRALMQMSETVDFFAGQGRSGCH